MAKSMATWEQLAFWFLLKMISIEIMKMESSISMVELLAIIVMVMAIIAKVDTK